MEQIQRRYFAKAIRNPRLFSARAFGILAQIRSAMPYSDSCIEGSYERWELQFSVQPRAISVRLTNVRPC
jgi:hypothetical protein